jgi:HAD superfamily hydrolase (TIGR01490 family)
MTLALFDLDNTLIGGDSDHLWGEYLCEKGLVDPDSYAAHNEQFYRDYQRGELDIHRYLEFALKPLRDRDPAELKRWHEAFMREKIEPILLPAAEELLEGHRRQGHALLIITATNDFVTRPIAERLGVETLIASIAESVGGRFTGRSIGIPTYREGKVQRLTSWMKKTGQDLRGSWFYSDSHNDLPLLRLVDNPVAVDPDETLRAEAEAAGWPVITLREAR